MYYQIQKTEDQHPSNEHFCLHNHDFYEIYLFIEGDSKYIVEGNSYTLEPYDIILIKKHEMHRVYHNSPTPYKRIVLSVSPEFFVLNHCTEYEQYFTDTLIGTGNKIVAELVQSSGLYDAFLRLKKYSDKCSDKSSPVINATITEILYLISTINEFSSADIIKNPIKNVIMYINNHYTENIKLDELEKKFFISKYHICRLFKQTTGLTVHEYVTSKRLIHACELKANGIKLGDAASLSGFSCYSAFYKAYLKQYGVSPKNEL